MALKHYKNERINTENDLISTIKKVNLDKAILFREKQTTLWKEGVDQNQSALVVQLRKEK